MKRIVVGLLASVDSGKTTLSEAFLYQSGEIRSFGRVDHGNTFLDTDQMEKDRGITIFSKQASFHTEEAEITLLDTPGHVDFSAEMERTLRVLDYAVLVVSASDGVQGHTETLWQLLKRYKIPVFIFVNKMDMPDTDKKALLLQCQEKLDENCVDFTLEMATEENKDAFYEELAVCHETLLEEYSDTGAICFSTIQEGISNRMIFPVMFGSALRLDGTDQLLQLISVYTKESIRRDSFGAYAYKIMRDSQGNKVTFMKITGGSLKVKSVLEEEKINQLRIYSGAKYTTLEEAKPGMICGVLGLENSYVGQCFGEEVSSGLSPMLEPVLHYQLLVPEEVDIPVFVKQLKSLEEEQPELHIVWNCDLQEIHLNLMGNVQIQVLAKQIQERFGVKVGFGPGKILYKETIASTVEGVGHFEPLRHYAEVHLLMEPGEPGSGLVFDCDCSEDILSKNWQRLVLTHLNEKEHKGVLTGAPITDMKITLVSGRAHTKHTEGGDFRQATYRAVRQGLKKAESVLLEPFYSFEIVVPSENIGRVMTDITNMSGTFGAPEMMDSQYSILKGTAPVILLENYQEEIRTFTKGYGKISCRLFGYRPCHNAEEVILETGYDSESDIENPTGSVFCSHGAGTIVPWDQVEAYMHMEGLENYSGLDYANVTQNYGGISGSNSALAGKNASKENEYHGMYGSYQEEKELQAIFAKTFGEPKRRLEYQGAKVIQKEPTEEEKAITEKYRQKNAEKKEARAIPERYLLVDGYNIIFSWTDLKALSEHNLEAARTKLMDILCNYQGYTGVHLILVFDAYKVKGNPGEVFSYHNIHVVYTKEAETADMYIEKVTHEIGRKHQVTVATSDGTEQIIILGEGALRMSAREFEEEIERINQEIRMEYLDKRF